MKTSTDLEHHSINDAASSRQNPKKTTFVQVVVFSVSDFQSAAKSPGNTKGTICNIYTSAQTLWVGRELVKHCEIGTYLQP